MCRRGKERRFGQRGNVTSNSVPPKIQPLHKSFRIKMAPLSCSEVDLGKLVLSFTTTLPSSCMYRQSKTRSNLVEDASLFSHRIPRNSGLVGMG